VFTYAYGLKGGGAVARPPPPPLPDNGNRIPEMRPVFEAMNVYLCS